MAQKRNLNINPYYDDFSSNNNFYKVLFKPGFPVQARELTTLQSILQNQIEDFGSHVFKEGSVVIPGNISYDSQFYAVKLNSTNFGVDISLYLNLLLGKKIVGQNSGTTATIQYIALPNENANIDDITIYVKYVDSNNNFIFDQFEDGESLFAEENITYGNTTISAGTSFASLINLNATSIGSAASIGEGVYFIRGYFVGVSKQTILLDEYTNSPSYRVGLKISETIVSAKDDASLYDNAKGFSNYAAPGADRLKITLTLTKKLLTDTNDTDFVELLRVRDGKKKFIESKTQYNLIKDYLAERTNDESGSYSVNPFNVSVHNSLNDGLGKGGLYFKNQKTDELNTPSDDLMSVMVSPGKAYVKGYDVETTGTTNIDVEKPRETKLISNANVPFTMGNLLRVNNVSGGPQERSIINLYSQHNASGVGIGKARLYAFNLTDSAYIGNSTKWDLYLYDVQTYTIVGLNTSLTASKSSYIQGKNSGANGFTVSSSTGTKLTLIQTSGRFSIGEQITLNGEDISRTITSVNAYGTRDIKSVDSSVGIGFTADTFLDKFALPNGIAELTISGTDATSPGNVFTGIKTDSIISYQRSTAGFKTETFNRVSAVSADGLTLTLAGIDTVTGVFDGAIADGTYQVKLNAPIIRNNDSAYLYEKLPKSNISSVNLASSNLYIREQLTGQNTSVGLGNSLTIDTSTDFSGIGSVTFTAFDSERYSIHYSNGGIGTITADSFVYGSDEITFKNLSNDTNTTVNATLIKTGIKSKKKEYIRSTIETVTKSVSGVTTSISGLTKSQYYGLRVQDKEISLNYPDVVKVLAVYESVDTGSPTFDKLTFASSVSDSIIGENIISSDSNAIARVVQKSGNTVDIVYLNRDRFVQGERVTFEESTISQNITSITLGKYKDLTNSYVLDKGQREQYYDYSRIIRDSSTPVPSKKLSIVFDRYSVPTNDTGDVFTVLSYDNERYSEDIPEIGEEKVRASDTLDFRPRVSYFDSSSATSSPFDFDSRSFTAEPTRFLAPNEDSLVGYEFYLGRIDKLYISKTGILSIVKGNSAEVPQEPISNNDDLMELATITLPPYLYDPNDASISLVDNKRYTMRDIGRIEDRVENLEEVTSLSLLELNVQSLQIRDADGNDKFKSGFFVDDFKNNSLINLNQSVVSVDTTNKELTPFISQNSLESLPAFAENKIDAELDLFPDSALLDSNVQKTGQAITLKYEEDDNWIQQPLATRVENVNPFHVVDYTGFVNLTPASDSWVRTIRAGTANIGWGSIVTSVRDVVVSAGTEQFMRSRNTQFVAKNLKPLTRFYQFMDGISGIDFIPKLIEIATDSTLEIHGSSAAFRVGEEVIGSVNGQNLIRFRVAKSNHKEGSFNSPSLVYNINPYVKEENISEEYSQSSKVLNVDTFSLAQQAQGRYSGYVTKGMLLVGQTSGAIAYVKDLRLVSDNYGDLIGSFFIRNPLSNPAPTVRISTGTKTYRLTNSSTNAKPLPGSKLITSAQTSYVSTGRWEVRQLQISRRNPPPPPPIFYGDPLAQTFAVGGNISDMNSTDIDSQSDDREGAFVTAVDLFFANIPSGNDEIRIEIREVELGIPTQRVIGSPAVLTPRTNDTVNIITSTTGEIATKVVFPEPIYLSPGKEYAIVALAPTTDEYELWIAQMGETTVNTQSLPDAEAVRYTKQFALGSLFKSQNGSVWTPNQYQDLKFKLYKAKFTQTSGTAFFYNPTLHDSNTYVPTLGNNPIRTLPKTGSIGITTITESQSDYTTLRDDIFRVGRKLSGATPNSSAFIVGTGSSVVSAEVTTGGSNYNSSISNGETFTITGQGENLKVNITPASGSLSGTVTISEPGTGYQVGDVVGIVTGTGTGQGGTLTITDIEGIDTLFLAGVQGEFGNGKAFATGIGVSYYNDSGTIISMGTGIGNTEITRVRDTLDPQFSGNYFRVSHFDHGMYSGTDRVEISDVQSNHSPIILNAELSSDTSTGGTISVNTTTNFDTFEGMAVDGTNIGYVKIENEIIGYSAVNPSSNTLTISSRGIDNTQVTKHSINSEVYKYELNGISLRRINTTHTVDSNNIDADFYNIVIDRGSSLGADRSSDTASYPQLSFFDESHLGGENCKASQNIIFSEVVPKYDVLTPGSSTSATASIRTVSGTSVSGNETAFVDQGFENVELNQLNRLTSPRIIASKVNEDMYLTSLPRNKSFTTGITLRRSGDNDSVSPIIYYNSREIQPSTEFRFARLNQPISDYAADNRVNSPVFDPHAAIYVSNTIKLNYAATSLKVFVDAYRDATADFRVLYQLIRADSSEIQQEFELFPGYDNLSFTDENGYSVIDSSKNTGRPDSKVRSSLENEFLEYEFTANDIDEFIGYTIKIVMSGTNQARYPRFKNFRSIATR